MTPLIAEMVRLAPDPELLQWFDASSLASGQMSNFDVLIDTPLPFDRCAVVGVEGDAKWLIILAQVGEVVSYVGYTMHRNHYIKHPAFTYIRDADGITLKTLDKDDIQQWGRETVRGLLATVGAWLAAINQETKAYKPVARPSLINSKRAAKGQGPLLFDWHTVKIEPPSPKAEHQGNTHASPRLHDRRGHVRRLSNGKTCWVKPCKVGDASKGIVFKDYQITGRTS
jgi:hypothetical protein